MHGYFRTLCVGYGLYAVGNTILMILLYFTDYGALSQLPLCLLFLPAGLRRFPWRLTLHFTDLAS